MAAENKPDVVAALVDRFLAWRLPKSVCSDLCVTDRNYSFQRTGTNLLTAEEARQMVDHLLEPLWGKKDDPYHR